MIALLLACTPENPGETRDPPEPPAWTGPGTETATETGSVRPLEVELGPERVWSAVAPLVDQHHATVAALAHPAVPEPGEAAALVAWTDGERWQTHVSRLEALDRDGVAVLGTLALDGGANAEKPDTDVDPQNRAIVAYKSEVDGIEIERVALDPPTTERVTIGEGAAIAGGNNSVDLAVRADGSTLLVWYDQQPPVGRYRTAALDADLAPIEILPPILAEVDDSGPSTPDIDVDPVGRIALAWVDQHFYSDPADLMLLQAWEADGTPRWTLELDRTDPPAGPRRATVAFDPLGRLAVGWRKRAEDYPVPSVNRLAFVDAEGQWLREPFEPFVGNTDDLVIANVGEDAIWMVWTAEPDPVEGLGVIMGALMGFPSGEILVGPLTLSTSTTASRPHTDTAPWGEDSFGVVVSWEEADARGVRVLHGRAGVIE